MEFTEAESNMNDLVSEYQQYQAGSSQGFASRKHWISLLFYFLRCSRGLSPGPLQDATAEEEGLRV